MLPQADLGPGAGLNSLRRFRLVLLHAGQAADAKASHYHAETNGQAEELRGLQPAFFFEAYRGTGSSSLYMIASNMTVDFCSAAQDGPSLLRYSRLGKHGSGSGEVDTKRSFRDLAGERLETWRPHGHGIRSQYEGSHMFSNSGHEARSLPPPARLSSWYTLQAVVT